MSQELSSPPDRLFNASLFQTASFIDGQWVNAASGKTIAVTDPGNGAVIGHVAAMSAQESRKAVDAAHRAFPAWSVMLPQDRAALLRR
ncbi:MAG TPA: NAD-dependent succinate-semialdehyde dehydrogenase, partial [Rhodospirillaceae bacterium]|nr:NAD-dependent succinate-semialdehyde dehydrogenase [Rhodospirillaceae bacterium]